MSIRDEYRPIEPEPSKIRKGRFLWLEDQEQQKYLQFLRKRIKNGYFFSESIIAAIVDEMAPVIEDAVSRETSVGY